MFPAFQASPTLAQQAKTEKGRVHSNYNIYWQSVSTENWGSLKVSLQTFTSQNFIKITNNCESSENDLVANAPPFNYYIETDAYVTSINLILHMPKTENARCYWEMREELFNLFESTTFTTTHRLEKEQTKRNSAPFFDANKEAKMLTRSRSSANEPWRIPSGKDNTRIHEQKNNSNARAN